MEKKVVYETEINNKQILNLCNKKANMSDRNEISLFLDKYKNNCKKEFKYKFLRGFIISELIIIMFFGLISIIVKHNFLINNFFEIYQFFLLPIIVYGIVGIWYIFNKKTIITSLEKMINYQERDIFVSDIYVLQKYSKENIGNSIESGYIEFLIFKKENDFSSENFIIGKNKKGIIWDDIKENKKYKFYAISEKIILGIISIE